MTFAGFILCAALAAAEPQPPTINAANDELAAYLREAAQNHPGLRAAHERWRAAQQRLPQVTALDDPMFTFGQFIQSDASRMKLSLSQKFPWFGTLRLRGDKAAAEAEAALERFYAMRNEVFEAVKIAYFEYAFLAGSISVTEAQIEILEFMEENVRANYSLGLAPEDELLRTQIELTSVTDTLDSFRQMRPAMSARLAEALGRTTPSEPLPWPQDAELPSPAPGLEDVLAAIYKRNPDLIALDRTLESRETAIELARKKGYPDITVGIDYTSVSVPDKVRPDRPFPASLHGARRLLTGTTNGVAGALTDVYAVAASADPISNRSVGEDNVMLFFNVNLPIWRSKIKAGVEEAKALESATESQKRRQTLSLEHAAQMAIFEMQDARRRYDLYESSLLPQAEQTYQSVQSSYATGAADTSFLDLLESVRVLLNFELDQLRAKRDLHLGAARLERLMGGEWRPEETTE